MLLSVTIKNIALIEEMTIPFDRGLHVMTGETGAGKSIVVDAVNLALGGRADKDLIRSGCEKAYVEAVFDISNQPQVQKLLSEQELETDGGLLTISREISRSGKNICRIMGMGMQLSYLRQITALLMDVHGQHEHQFLMDPKFHLRFLDEFAGEKHKQLLAELSRACEAFMKNHREFVQLYKAANDREQRMDMLRFQCDELKKAKLKRGEEEALQAERQRFRHGEKIRSSIENAYESIYAGASNALSLVRKSGEALRSVAQIDPEFARLADRLESLYFEMEDLGLTLREMNSQQDFDPERLNSVENRLDLLTRLGRKYGADSSAMIAYYESAKAELQTLESLEDTLAQVQEEHRRLLKAYREKARQATLSRKETALAFENQMHEQLKDLGMGSTVFKTAFHEPDPEAKKPMPTPLGDDLIEFLIAPNPGEPLKPLSRIASGGELSRLMLAIKGIAAQRGQVDCMVFDEIDTGISGRMAQVVAEKMDAIARHKQVICVTHLPQIAAMADRQYLVEKSVIEGKTHTCVRLMAEDERIQMIARMIGGAGEDSDESALRHAQGMILSAQRLKNQ